MKIKKIIATILIMAFAFCFINVSYELKGKTISVQVGAISAKADVNPGPEPLDSVTHGGIELNDVNPGPEPLD